METRAETTRTLTLAIPSFFFEAELMETGVQKQPQFSMHFPSFFFEAELMETFPGEGRRRLCLP